MTLRSYKDFDHLQQAARRLARSARTWSGVVYRSVTPEYANLADLISGKGSQLFGGRWNPPRSFPSVYGSSSPEAAMSECLAHYRYFNIPLPQAMPRVFVAVQVRLQRLVDLTTARTLVRLGLSHKKIIEADWRRENDLGRESLTQAIGRALHQARLEGLLAPSARVPGATTLVVFPDVLRSRSYLKIDHQDQL